MAYIYTVPVLPKLPILAPTKSPVLGTKSASFDKFSWIISEFGTNFRSIGIRDLRLETWDLRWLPSIFQSCHTITYTLALIFAVYDWQGVGAKCIANVFEGLLYVLRKENFEKRLPTLLLEPQCSKVNSYFQ